MHDILRNYSIMEEKEYIIFHSTLTPLEGGGPLGGSPFPQIDGRKISN